MSSTLYLRCDVDFRVGLKKGVPYIAQLLNNYEWQSSFFIVMGADTIHQQSRRTTDPRFKTRYKKMNPLRLVWHFGLPIIHSAVLEVMVGPSDKALLQQLAASGHEIGVHGYNHLDWSNNCFSYDKKETRRQIEKAQKNYRSIFPNGKWSWAAPGWRCNSYMFDVLESYNVKYSSDMRGNRPFFPLLKTGTSPVLQFPVTLPCLHELIQIGLSRQDAIDFIISQIHGDFNVLCVHGYYEGILERQMFADLLAALRQRNIYVQPLREAYKAFDVSRLDADEIATITVPGGTVPISCQSSFTKENYFRALDAGHAN